MGNYKFKRLFNLSVLLFLSFSMGIYADYYEELSKEYSYYKNSPSDINEHLPALYELAKECTSAVEIGVRGMVSTWAILKGLTDGNGAFYVGIDLQAPPLSSLDKAETLALQNGILFRFIQANDMDIDISETDLLFIDSLHTYCHLTYELEKFASKARKYIALHDTSPPWAFTDDIEYNGDYSEYPAFINREKRGLWPAVQDFLKNHPEWQLKKRYTNNNGFTVLVRGSMPKRESKNSFQPLIRPWK